MNEAPVAEPLTLRLRDGRTLSACVIGAPSAIPVVVFHGTPGGRLGPPPPAILCRPDVRLVCFDRPGYGGSTRRLGERVVMDIVEDVEELLGALRIDAFAAFGISGGGPFALACATRMGTRMRALSRLASPASRAEGFDFTAGMNPTDAEECRLATGDPDILLAFIEKEAARMLADAPPPVAPSFAHALAQGVGGWFDDARMFGAGWRFSIQGTAVPTRIFHGDADDVVPPAHAKRLCAALSDASITWLPGVGHFPMTPHAPAALDFLCERFQASQRNA
jgi:pimeloyl-ACP methyl ester carboxylesterase